MNECSSEARTWTVELTGSGSLEGAGGQSPAQVEYYKLRASAGLVITEACAVSVKAQGYSNAPGL